MAKRRTKKEKIIARLRRQVKTQAAKPQVAKRSHQKKEVKYGKKVVRTAEKDDIFGYNPSLIKKDLQKTALLSILFTIIILGLWFWQQNNWWLPKF